MLARISDTIGTGGSVVAVTEQEYDQAVRAMYAEDADADTTAAVETFLAGGPDADEAAIYLGVAVEDLDPDDRDEVDDQTWGRWLDAQLDPRTHRWIAEVPGGGGVQVTIKKATGDGVWPGGPVQVLPLHGERERSWIKASGWGDVREAVDAARDAEVEALAQLAREQAAERARFDALRAAHQAVADAERALDAARLARTQAARRQVESGDTMYRIAKELHISAQSVAKWLN